MGTPGGSDWPQTDDECCKGQDMCRHEDPYYGLDDFEPIGPPVNVSHTPRTTARDVLRIFRVIR